MRKLRYGMREISADDDVVTAADALALVVRAFGAPTTSIVRAEGQILTPDTVLATAVVEVIAPLAPKG